MSIDATPTFAPPAPPTVRKRHNGRIFLAAVIAMLAFGAAKQATATPTTPTSPTLTNADIDVMALDATWQTNGAEVCTALNKALATGLDHDFVIQFGVDTFAKNISSPMTAAMTASLRAHLEAC